MEVSWFWPTLIMITLFIATNLLTRKKNPKKLPPSPIGLPILGHLHMLGKNPHQDLHRLARKHGPIMYMRFGLSPIVVVSSAEAAELFLKTHDLAFASRPPLLAAKYMSWDQRGLTFAAYGPYWRNMRKLCTLQLLSSLKIASFEAMRRQELGFLVETLKEAARENVAVDLSAKISGLAAEMSCRMLFGKKYDDKEIDERGFKNVIQEGMHLAAVANLGDYFPFLGTLDLQGLTRKMKALAKVYDDFFEKVIDDHVRDDDDDGQMKDIVGTMMSIMQTGESEFQFDRRHVKAVLLDLLAASMDTAASAVEWILSELLKNPTIMIKLQEELEQVVGLDRAVEESDLDRLQYLDMVIKETFRLHPVAPFLVPHYAIDHCTVNGYHIPKQSRIFVNTYAIGRDPNVWPDPEKFDPERFIGSEIDVRGQHFELLPFGSGRRGCPGIQLGLIQVRVIVAQIVHCFDWKLPDNMLPEKLDMTEEFGLVVARANHLMAIPTLRLQK